MEVVVLGSAKLNRIGTASGRGGFGGDRTAEVTREILDDSANSLRELVVSVAEEHGEQRGSLNKMTEEGPYGYGQHKSVIVFNIHGPNTVYSNPYAECFAFPALKVGGRYFKLEEVKLRG